jgi:hypothetical protein
VSYDLINAALVSLGGLFLIFTIWDIYRVKSVVGTHWATVLFFFLWACWNVVWYWSLGQPFTLMACSAFVVLNGWWLYLVVRYR